MRKTTILKKVRSNKFAEILSVNGISIQRWNQTGYGRRLALALMVEAGQATFVSDVEIVDFDKIVGIPSDKMLDIESMCNKHKIYFDGLAPLVRTAQTILREVNIDLAPETIMEIFSTYGFTDPNVVLPVKQIFHQLGIVTQMKVVRNRSRRRSKKSVLMVLVKESRKSILTKIYNLGQPVNLTPTKVIAYNLYTVGTETKKAEQVSTGDYYGTIHRIFIGGRLVNVGYSKTRPTAAYTRSMPIPFNHGTPFLTKTVNQVKAGEAPANEFGIDSVVDFTLEVINDREGVAKIHWAVTRPVVTANKEVSDVAKKGYDVMKGSLFKYDSVASATLQEVVGVADDTVVTEPVTELVVAGPNAPTSQFALPQSSWTPETN